MAEIKDFVKPLGWLFFVFIVISAIGIYYLTAKEISSGTIYIFMLLMSVVLLILAWFISQGNSTLDEAFSYLKDAEKLDLKGEMRRYLIGFWVLAVIYPVVNLLTSFNITSLSIPLFASNIISTQSFAAAQIIDAMNWKVFIIMFVAGTIETFVFNFVAPITFAIVASFIAKAITEDENSGWHSKWFINGFALVTSLVLFAAAHIFNGSYTVSNFIAAGIFMLITNATILYDPRLLISWLGLHQMNNLLYLITIFGFLAVLKGFGSIFGAIFIVLMLVLLYFALRKSK